MIVLKAALCILLTGTFIFCLLILLYIVVLFINYLSGGKLDKYIKILTSSFF